MINQRHLFCPAMRNVVISITIAFVAVSCDYSTTSNNTHTNYRHRDEQYLNYDTTGRFLKYFDSQWNLVHYKSDASYYRDAFYINGVVVADSIARDYYISGELQFEGHVATENPDKLVGLGTWYYRNGQKETQYTQDIQGRIHGEYMSYYENGNIKVKTYYKDGLVSGKYCGYYESGKKHFVGNYKDNLFEGLQQVYYESGKVESIYYYKEGKLNGLTKEYYENGRLRMTKNWSMGICTGVCKEYYENGRLKATGQLSNNRKVGVWTYYDEYGYPGYMNYDQLQVYYVPRGNNYRSGSPRSNYQELWDECEYLQDLLEENDIDPDYYLSYPMDYYELEDLKSDLESQLEDNDIDY